MQLAEFLQQEPEQLSPYWRQAGSDRGVAAHIVEKDFWVCFLLRELFRSEVGEYLVFKGGTSLSKIHGAIQRFSEDVDLTLSPQYLGLAEVQTSELTKNQADKWRDKAHAACREAVEGTIKAALTEMLGHTGGPALSEALCYRYDEHTDCATLQFGYPTVAEQKAASLYIQPVVRLEFGCRTDQQPTTRQAVTPWLLDEVPTAIDDWHAEVVALELARTFWEKATTLHREHHRAADKPGGLRISRHYSDVVAISRHPQFEEVLADAGLRDDVVAWTALFFRAAWARYDEARPPTFRLVPHPGHQAALRQDYQAMAEMFFDDPMPFDQMIDELTILEKRINDPD